VPKGRWSSRPAPVRTGGPLSRRRERGEGRKPQQAVEFVVDGDEGGAGVVSQEGLHECGGVLSFAGKVLQAAPQGGLGDPLGADDAIKGFGDVVLGCLGLRWWRGL